MLAFLDGWYTACGVCMYVHVFWYVGTCIWLFAWYIGTGDSSCCSGLYTACGTQIVERDCVSLVRALERVRLLGVAWVRVRVWWCGCCGVVVWVNYEMWSSLRMRESGVEKWK